MIDPDRLETARAILIGFLPLGLKDPAGDAVIVADELHRRLESTQQEQKGHPAETALEQLLNLLAEHHDARLVKWVAANAKVKGLGELCTYLGSERGDD